MYSAPPCLTTLIRLSDLEAESGEDQAGQPFIAERESRCTARKETVYDLIDDETGRDDAGQDCKSKGGRNDYIPLYCQVFPVKTC